MPGLTYGPVQLINVVTKSYENRAVYNGADYIHTEHTLWGSATVHPNTVVDAVNGGPYGTGVDAVAGIQAAFNQPRQDLTFEVGIVPFEAMTFDQDAQTGPEPIHFSAAVVYGAKTVECLFGIKWSTVLVGDTDPPPITSNRWVMSHDYDEHFILTITTKGLATFRRDALLTWGTSADDYRSWLFVPIPIGYHRTLGPITLSQDGLSVDYTITDRRIIMESNDPKVAHMAMRTSLSTDFPSLYEFARGGLNAGALGLGGFGALRARRAKDLAEARGPKEFDLVKAGWGAATKVGTVWGAIAGVIKLAGVFADALPRTHVSIEIDTYGTPTANTDELITATQKVMLAKIAKISTTLSGASISMSVDSEQRLVQANWVFAMPPSILATAIPETEPSNLNQAAIDFLGADSVTGYADAKETYQIQKGPGQDDETDNLGFIGDDILEVLVAATLQPAAPDLLTVNPVPAPNLEEAGPPTLTNPPEGRLE
jgi:hypothetical protein